MPDAYDGHGAVVAYYVEGASYTRLCEWEGPSGAHFGRSLAARPQLGNAPPPIAAGSDGDAFASVLQLTRDAAAASPASRSR